MTLKKKYKSTPIVHNWNRYHTHPSDPAFNSARPVRRTADLPLPENPHNRLMTNTGAALECTVAECLGCSLVFMQPFRAAAVTRSVPANPMIGSKISHPFAHNIEDCVTGPLATSEVAKKLLKLLLESLPSMRAIYKDNASDDWDGQGRETKEKEYLLGCRSSLLWEFRIPESRVRDARPTITASISDASFQVPLRWKKLRKLGYSCELRGINITEAVGREASFIRWPHELNMEINNSKVFVAPPEPNSTRRDTAIDISGYVHGGENHLNVKMQINTELIEGQTIRMNQAFKLGITLLKNKKLEDIILTIVRRNITELSVQLLLVLRRRGIYNEDNIPWAELRSIIRNLSYEWYNRLGEVTNITRNDPNVWRTWLNLVNYSLPAKSIKADYQKQDDVECLTNVNDLKINLIDCVSLSRLNVPMRGRFCRHSQPIDLLYYLQIVSMMPPRRNRYICPICQAEIQLMDIVIDWDLLFEIALNKKIKYAEHLFVQLDHMKNTLTYEIESQSIRGAKSDHSSDEESDDKVVTISRMDDETIVKPDPEADAEEDLEGGPSTTNQGYIDVIDLSDD